MSPMGIRKCFEEAGFHRVFVLDAAACGVPDTTSVILAVWTYQAERETGTVDCWIHPYYDASQQAYLAGRDVLRRALEAGVELQWRPDIRLKPILSRLPDMTRGRNTLNYLSEVGSRFHVQTFSTTASLPFCAELLPEIKPLHCGACRRCMEACPTGAIDDAGYHRERCLRNWQSSGTAAPEWIRKWMGNRLLGCDECQRCCPHNPAPDGTTQPTISLLSLLENPKETCAELAGRIGVNMALPNRMLAQACLNAGCSGKPIYLQVLQRLTEHPSPAVAECAAWGIAAIGEGGAYAAGREQMESSETAKNCNDEM